MENLTAPRRPAPPISPDSSPLPGNLDEDYEVEGILGRGGNGVVYAVRERSTGAELALKISPFEPSEPRAEREVLTHLSLDHPHLLKVHHAGVLEAEVFLVMDRAQESLEEWITGHHDPSEAWRGLEQVAGAVEYLHAEGVVHRDLKPSNILRTDDGWCLMDLGLARSRSDARITRAGTILGTPGYLAPEQARGEEATAAADVFALGVLAYRILEGRLPYQGTDPGAMLLAVARGNLVPPRRAYRILNPKALETLLAALSPDASERPATLEDLFLEPPNLEALPAPTRPIEPAPTRQAIDRRLAVPDSGGYTTALLAGALLGVTGAIALVQVALAAIR